MMVFLGLGWSVFSQQDPVLMRIGGKDVLRSEFEYNYNRDKASLAPKDAAPEKYAERFVNFKLKVAAAEAAGLDTALAFRERVEDYRSRLIKSYLTDTVVTEKAARRLYDKMKSGYRAGQVRVSHILNTFLRMYPVPHCVMRLPGWTPFMSIFKEIRIARLLIPV